jgi:hypothetical protein
MFMVSFWNMFCDMSGEIYQKDISKGILCDNNKKYLNFRNFEQ